MNPLPNHIVMFDKNTGNALYLQGVLYGVDGLPLSGSVANGGWEWSVDRGEELAKDSNGYIRNRWPRRVYTIVPVTHDMRGDYNTVIERARLKLGGGETFKYPPFYRRWWARFTEWVGSVWWSLNHCDHCELRHAKPKAEKDHEYEHDEDSIPF